MNKIIAWLASLLAVSGATYLLSVKGNINILSPGGSQTFVEQPQNNSHTPVAGRFECRKVQGFPTVVTKVSKEYRGIISPAAGIEVWGSRYTLDNRCDFFASQFNYYEQKLGQGNIGLDIGFKNNLNIICVTDRPRHCIDDSEKGQIATVAPNINAQEMLKRMVLQLNPNVAAQSPALVSNQEAQGVSVDIEKVIMQEKDAVVAY